MRISLSIFFTILVLVTARVRLRDERQWSNFKTKFEKKYETIEQEQKSREIFFQNAREVRLHNRLYAKGEVTYKKTINRFSDRNDEEIIKRLAGLKIEKMPEGPLAKADPNLEATSIPDFYNGCWSDWPVRNQGSCGSCWAFSTIASIESAYRTQTNISIDLSEQHLNDCVYTRSGCNGGWMPTGFDFIKNNNGTIQENLYPYTGTYGSCQASSLTKSIELNLNPSYYQVASDDLSIKNKILDTGPLCATVDCSDWSKYAGGIYTNTTRNFAANHAVIVCGWGTLNNVPYWIIRNSWDTNWGMSGYIYVNANRIGTSTVTQGGMFTQYCFYPVLK